MHRSGTSILAKVLEEGGVFMGVRKDHNYEATHFLSLNQQTLKASGNNWLEPIIPSKENWKMLSAKELFLIHFKLVTKGQRLLYRFKNPKWGFKDPRTTFTLPMWLSIFPNAKVIHLVRDTEAVAKSLYKRNQVVGEIFDERLDDLDFNRKLAQKYVTQARSYASKLGKSYLEITYEDLVKKDDSTIETLEKFTSTTLKPHFKKYIR
jgi:hypothetical protein